MRVRLPMPPFFKNGWCSRVGTAHQIDAVGRAHPTVHAGWRGEWYSDARAVCIAESARACEYACPCHPFSRMVGVVGWALPTKSMRWAVPTLQSMRGGVGSGTPMPVLSASRNQHGHASTPAHATLFQEWLV